MSGEQDARGSMSVDPKRVRPPRRHALVRVDERTDQTPGGIVVPWIAQDLPNAAVVIAVGDDVSADVRGLVGRRVLLERHAHADRGSRKNGEPIPSHALWLEGAYGPRYLVCRDWQIIAEVE